MKNKGFSLAEVVITLAIIGVVATLTMSTVFRHRPNQEMLMLKKVYYLAGRIVNELINDEDLYPANAAQTSTHSGFGYDDAATYHEVTYQGNTKFCKTFAARMNVKGDNEDAIKCESDYSTPKQKETPKGTFTTIDDVVWFMPISSFRSNGKDEDGNELSNEEINEDNNRQATQSIYVDVNGNEGPNCLAQNFDNTECGPKGPDRFQIHVDRWGKMSPVGQISQEYLDSPNNALSYMEIKAKWEKQHSSGN